MITVTQKNALVDKLVKPSDLGSEDSEGSTPSQGTKNTSSAQSVRVRVSQGVPIIK